MPDVVVPPPTDPSPSEPTDAPTHPPSQLIPGNIPFPPIDENAPVVVEPSVPPPPPPAYPHLPRGLKPPVPPTPEELEDLAMWRAMRDFFRASAYHHGDGGDEGYGRRVREGDVTRWRDASNAADASGSGRVEEEDEEEGEDGDDGFCDAKWIRGLAKSFKLEDYPVMDERIVPREILDVVFGRDAGGSAGGSKKKKRGEDGDDDDGSGLPTSPKRAKNASTAMNTTQSRLERLVRLEQKAAEEARTTPRRGRKAAGTSPHARRSNRGGGASSTPGRDHDGDHSGDDDHSDDGYDDENAHEGGARRGEGGGRSGESRGDAADGHRERADDLRGRDEEDDDSGSDGDYGRGGDFDDDDDGFDDDRDDQAEAFY